MSAALDVAELAARARSEALAAIRLLESRLREEAGGCLRGLPELAPGYRAANVRAVGVKRWGMKAWLRPGRTHLCVGKDGTLHVAWLVEDAGPPASASARWRDALDSDILAEDLEPLAQVAADLLRRHASRLDKTAAAHGRVVELAGRLSRALRI